MKQITDKLIAIIVPEDSCNFYYDCENVILYDSEIILKSKGCKGGIYDLPKSKIISTTKDISKEQAEKIVHFEPNMGWEDYMSSFLEAGSEYCLGTYKQSFQSLIEANGLDINKNYLICSIIK